MDLINFFIKNVDPFDLYVPSSNDYRIFINNERKLTKNLSLDLTYRGFYSKINDFESFWEVLSYSNYLSSYIILFVNISSEFTIDVLISTTLNLCSNYYYSRESLDNFIFEKSGKVLKISNENLKDISNFFKLESVFILSHDGCEHEFFIKNIWSSTKRFNNLLNLSSKLRCFLCKKRNGVHMVFDCDTLIKSPCIICSQCILTLKDRSSHDLNYISLS